MLIPSMGDSLCDFYKSPIRRVVLEFSEGQPGTQRSVFGIPFYLCRATPKAISTIEGYKAT